MNTITRDTLLDTSRRNEIAAYAAYAAAEAAVGIATRKAAAALVDWRAKVAAHDAIWSSTSAYEAALADAIAITTKAANEASDPVRHFVFSPSAMTWHGRGR